MNLVNLGKKGGKTVLEFYRELGLTMWEHVGMARDEEGLKKAISKIQKLRDEFHQGFTLISNDEGMNKNLEVAWRVADFMELGELMAKDALNRKESCGGHFRVESQTEDGEAKRNDEEFSYVAAWEYQGSVKDSVLHKEPLVFDNVHPSQRSYK